MENNEYLCWVNLIGKDIDDFYTYELLFSDNPDEFWGDDFENKPMGLCNNLKPYEDSYNVIKIIKTDIKLDLGQYNCCFGFTDMADKIIPICWQNIDDLDEYPEDGRLILYYGDKYDEVEIKLAEMNILMENKEEDDE